jgi:hypothetical protein
MLSLLYISRSNLTLGVGPELEDLLARAMVRNLKNGITGALVHTGSDFAQVLEGPEGNVADVMSSILIDPRHSDVQIVRRDEVAARSFPNWGMALIGHLPETQAQIEVIRRAGDDAAFGSALDGLSDWMRAGASAAVTGGTA